MAINLNKYQKATIILILIVVGISLVWIIFFSRQAQERYIKKEIAEANYCEVASDCQMIAQSQCPFGCYVHVNKNKAGRIGKLLEDYRNTNYGTSCEYLCIEFKGVNCVNNTCQLIR